MFPISRKNKVKTGSNLWWLLALSSFILLTITACRQDNGSWERIKEAGSLKIGLDPTYPPFEATNGEALSGFDIDLANSLAAELGLEAEFVLFGYDGLYDALATGQVDVLISALVIIPEKRKDFAYSEPYFNAGELLVVLSEVRDISEMADLNGRILAVELGALGHVEATTWAKRVPQLHIVPYPSAAEALTAVQNQEADAALVDAISGHLFVKDNQSLKTISPTVTVEPFAIVARIEDEILLDQLNNSLAQIKESGQFDQIYNKWFGPGKTDE